MALIKIVIAIKAAFIEPQNFFLCTHIEINERHQEATNHKKDINAEEATAKGIHLQMKEKDNENGYPA